MKHAFIGNNIRQYSNITVGENFKGYGK